MLDEAIEHARTGHCVSVVGYDSRAVEFLKDRLCRRLKQYHVNFVLLAQYSVRVSCYNGITESDIYFINFSGLASGEQAFILREGYALGSMGPALFDHTVLERHCSSALQQYFKHF
jgi:hypothetical protein